MTTPTVYCSERVSDAVSWRNRPCSRKATVTRDGKPYCGVHDPVRVTERYAKRQAKRDAVCQYGVPPYSRPCGKPSVVVEEWRSGRCADHTEAALAATERLHKAAPALLAALEAVAEGDYSEGALCWCHRSKNHAPFCLQARAAIQLVKEESHE